MHKISRLILLILLTVGIGSQTAFGRSLSFHLYANSDDVIAGVESESPLAEATLNFGGGFLYSEDDYRMGSAHFTLKDDVFTPALTLGVSFEGVIGVAEDDDDYDLQALSFRVLGEYDFREVYYNFPILIFFDLSYAPDPLSFGDTEYYTEFNLGVKGYIVRSAAVVVGYKTIEVRFKDDPNDYKLTDDMVYIGLELSF